MKVSIVIPAYNEEDAIGKTLDEIFNTIKKMNNVSKQYDFEVIVVDNNSLDNTAYIAESKGARVVKESKQGYGEAYKRGFIEVTGDIIITGDADGSYPFYEIDRFLNIIDDEGFDFINTNRFGKLEYGSMPRLNYLGNKILTATINLYYDLNLKDSQSGMWIFKRKVLDKIDLSIMHSRMPFSQEIKIYVNLLGFKFIEIPIRYRSRIGKIKLNPFKDGSENFRDIFLFKKKLKMKNIL